MNDEVLDGNFELTCKVDCCRGPIKEDRDCEVGGCDLGSHIRLVFGELHTVEEQMTRAEGQLSATKLRDRTEDGR